MPNRNSRTETTTTREADMEVAIILTALIGIGFAVNLSVREEKRYKAQMAECRQRLLYQLGRSPREV
jgi:hypothetical protein